MPVLEADQTDIEKALYAQLVSMPEVVSLIVTTATGPAISPVNAAQAETLPRITYQLISDEPMMVLKGETGEKVATLHLKCWAKDPRTANSIAKAIAGRRANPRLAGWTWQNGLLGGLIHAAFIKVVDRASEIELPMQGGEPGEYWRLLAVAIQYSDPNEGP